MVLERHETILAGDVGGTNTRLLLFEVATHDQAISQPVPMSQHAPGTLVLCKLYENHQFSSFNDAVREFLRESKITRPPIAACVAVAGPVKDNHVRLTNRNAWTIYGDDLAEDFGIKVFKIVNDFLAVGYGILTLKEETECVILQDGEKDPTAPIACIGAGTGLGECFLTPDARGAYTCFPTEGGHAEFAPRNDLEIGLLQFLKRKFIQKHRVSVERVVSGIGLMNVYEYLCEVLPDKVNPQIHEKILAAGELHGKVIATNQANCELCAKTMEIFATTYGSECGVAGLKWLPYGGLYLTGGLTPKNIDLLRPHDGPFLEAFKDKGRVSPALYTIPVFAVMVDDLGQRGAHLLAFQALQQIVRAEQGMKSAASPSESSSNQEAGHHKCPFATPIDLPAPCSEACAFSRCCSPSTKLAIVACAAFWLLSTIVSK